MKFSYNWLQELVKFKQSPKELADLINLHITEVESASSAGTQYSGIIVAEILAIDKHPNADKLRLVTLDIGRGKQTTVVCGASNVEVGQKVPLALVGAKLPGGEIKPISIRGVESKGMICSAAELGLEEKSSGIMVLDKSASVGRPVNEFLDTSGDTVLDLKILSNRPDYLSYFGMSREIAAVLGQAWLLPVKLDYIESQDIKTDQTVSITVKDTTACPYYSARFLSDVEVADSPDWLKEKIISAGLRPINNLVDISNLVMLETGQPIHIFDADKLAGEKIIVRRAKDGEEFVTLDGQKISLTKDLLVIADADRPVALAGIMGGENSGVTDTTKKTIIEVANFNPAVIRRGSKKVGLSTDSSLRFERGLSVGLTKLAMDRAINLVKQVSPSALVAQGNVEVGSNQVKPVEITLSLKEVFDLLNLEITENQLTNILTNLGFLVKKSGDNFKIITPDFRSDIQEKADVIEELVRIIGIDKVKPDMPIAKMLPPSNNPLLELIKELKTNLVKAKFNEALSHSFIGEEWASKVGLDLDPGLELANPLSSQWTHLVPELWPNLLKFVTNNQALKKPINLFEINTVFEVDSKRLLPKETRQLALVSSLNTQDNYRLLKGMVEQIVARVPNLKLVAVPGRTDDKYINILRIMSESVLLGSIEEVSPVLADSISVPKHTTLAYINLDLLFELIKDNLNTIFKPFSYYPPSSFDISIELSQSTSAGNLINDIKIMSELVKEVKVFDVYKLDNGNRAIGLRVTLQADDRTLVEHEIKSLNSKVNNLITTQYRGKIRGSDSE